MPWKFKLFSKTKKVQENINEILHEAEIAEQKELQKQINKQEFDDLYPTVDMELLVEKATAAGAEMYEFKQGWTSNKYCFSRPFSGHGEEQFEHPVTLAVKIIIRGNQAAVFCHNRYVYDCDPFLARVMAEHRYIETHDDIKQYGGEKVEAQAAQK